MRLNSNHHDTSIACVEGQEEHCHVIVGSEGWCVCRHATKTHTETLQLLHVPLQFAVHKTQHMAAPAKVFAKFARVITCQGLHDAAVVGEFDRRTWRGKVGSLKYSISPAHFHTQHQCSLIIIDLCVVHPTTCRGLPAPLALAEGADHNSSRAARHL